MMNDERMSEKHELSLLTGTDSEMQSVKGADSEMQSVTVVDSEMQSVAGTDSDVQSEKIEKASIEVSNEKHPDNSPSGEKEFRKGENNEESRFGKIDEDSEQRYSSTMLEELLPDNYASSRFGKPGGFDHRTQSSNDVVKENNAEGIMEEMLQDHYSSSSRKRVFLKDLKKPRKSVNDVVLYKDTEEMVKEMLKAPDSANNKKVFSLIKRRHNSTSEVDIVSSKYGGFQLESQDNRLSLRKLVTVPLDNVKDDESCLSNVSHTSREVTNSQLPSNRCSSDEIEKKNDLSHKSSIFMYSFLLSVLIVSGSVCAGYLYSIRSDTSATLIRIPLQNTEEKSDGIMLDDTFKNFEDLTIPLNIENDIPFFLSCSINSWYHG